MYRAVLPGCVVAAVLWILSTGPVAAKESLPQAPPPELERWSFLVGGWDMRSTRYSFEGEAVEDNTGTAEVSWTLKGLRLQEIQSTTLAGRAMEVLNVFVFHPERREWEIARTDSLHHSFSVMRGQGNNGSIVFFERDPSPESDVARRWTYQRISDNRFRVLLEFSTDQGATWFRRNETLYTRRPAPASR